MTQNKSGVDNRKKDEDKKNKIYIGIVLAIMFVIILYFIIDFCVIKPNNDDPVETETETVTELVTETELLTEEITEPVTETEIITEMATETELITEAITETELVTEAETETELESEVESESETETYEDVDYDNFSDWVDNAEEGDYVNITRARVFYISEVSDFILCHVYDASETHSHIIYVYSDDVSGFEFGDLVSIKGKFIGRRYSRTAMFWSDDITIIE